jgi:hypothetical protein
MRKRNKIAIGVVLVVVVLVDIGLLLWWMPPTEPPLRVGMSEEEVEQALGPLGMGPNGWSGPGQGPIRIVTYYNPSKVFDPDTLNVYYEDDRAVKWERFHESNGRTLPSWLDRAKKRVGKRVGW